MSDRNVEDVPLPEETTMKVNEDAERVAELRQRISQLEAALRPFVTHALGYTSGVSRHGRWCAPKVTSEQMDTARGVLA